MQKAVSTITCLPSLVHRYECVILNKSWLPSARAYATIPSPCLPFSYFYHTAPFNPKYKLYFLLPRTDSYYYLHPLPRNSTSCPKPRSTCSHSCHLHHAHISLSSLFPHRHRFIIINHLALWRLHNGKPIFSSF